MSIDPLCAGERESQRAQLATSKGSQDAGAGLAASGVADFPTKTLRDEIFIAALTGLLAAGPNNPSACVKRAFELADDAMAKRGE